MSILNKALLTLCKCDRDDQSTSEGGQDYTWTENNNVIGFGFKDADDNCCITVFLDGQENRFWGDEALVLAHCEGGRPLDAVLGDELELVDNIGVDVLHNLGIAVRKFF